MIYAVEMGSGAIAISKRLVEILKKLMGENTDSMVIYQGYFYFSK
jgi:hypothetical protein